MRTKKLSMDMFRIIAAILIVAVHTFPLVSINETADFVFTHVICRIGVPFFLMITGFFILPKAIEDKNKLIKYLIKIAKIYVICMILYLPVNIYAGQLKGIGVIDVLKDIFINGTFYHLWYFPALILGMIITYFLAKHFNKKIVGICAIVLYIVGVFGDSYFGISSKILVISNIYSGIFAVSEYTRNGLFYAPMFLFLGYIFNNLELKISKKNNIIFVVISLILMILEGLILRKFSLQKHDSMYFMLIPAMFFVFNIILQGNEENNKKLRGIATIIYIIHPIFIIIVRGAGKVLHLENLMIDNSLIHYLLVVISSVIFSIIFEIIKEKVKNRINNN